ncbi:MAG TPA: rhodanese-like domain-containing protein [Candidatus Sulfopaludibacter sp.]|nr:rhodanese-like domain-containing protein [Candidatus Sulfopaludibacter sp.]
MKTLRFLLIGALAAAAAQMALIQPSELAARLSAKPAIFHVGFNVLYRSKHIPASVYAGPGSKPEGLALLKDAVAKLPRDREIVVYCGCCPWDHCPNIKPAMEMLQQMGFTKAKALYLPDNFKTDWLDKGYPSE